MSLASEDPGLDSILVKNTRNGEYGGFKLSLVDRELSDLEKHNVICTACNGILREPVISGSIFKCKSCLELEEVESATILASLTQKLHVYCPFKEEGCIWKDSIVKLVEHRNQCRYFLQKFSNNPDESIECCFKQYGCGVVTQRKRMPKHEEDHQTKHMKLMDHHIRTKDSMIHKLSLELVAVRTQVQEMNNQLKQVEKETKYTSGGIIFELPKINEKISVKTTQSYPINEFYVGLYKFQGTIRANHKDQKTIAVFIQSQRGDFDRELIWPLTGKYSVTLISKLDETSSISSNGTFTFKKDSTGISYACSNGLWLATHETVMKEKFSKGDSIKIKILVQFDAQSCSRIT